MKEGVYKKQNQNSLIDFRHIEGKKTALVNLLPKEISTKLKGSEDITAIENILIENSMIGDFAYEKSFYENSPLIKGLNEAEEIVLIFNNPIGDTILTLPLLFVIQKYLKITKQIKPIHVMVKSIDLFNNLTLNFDDNVKFFQYNSDKQLINNDKNTLNNNKRKYVININRYFDKYKELLGLSELQSQNSEYVLNILWRDWMVEDFKFLDKEIRYFALGERIVRNFEIMLGVKLFEKPTSVDVYLPKISEKATSEVLNKHNLSEQNYYISISVGSSEYAKEYSPTQWSRLIKIICKNYKNIKILYLRDPVTFDLEKPNAVAHYLEYDTMFQSLISEGHPIQIIDEKLDQLSPIIISSLLTITPDTGIGHFSAALGTPNVMLFFAADPYIWSLPLTYPVNHPIALKTHNENLGTYRWIWKQPIKDYVVPDENGNLIGTSQINVQNVFRVVSEIIDKYA